MIENIAHELIIAIVDSGFAESVMDAARAEGVRGGTITHCRGTSNEAMAKKYGVYVTPDKEMIWIVAPKEITDNVLKAIHDKIADQNPGKCIAFALPVTHTVGMKFEQQDTPNQVEENKQ